MPSEIAIAALVGCWLTLAPGGDAAAPRDGASEAESSPSDAVGDMQAPSQDSHEQLESGDSAAQGGRRGGERPGDDGSGFTRGEALAASLTIFVLAIFVGFEVITKVPPTLHTPLMSGSNAISGITIVGALLAAGAGLGLSSFVGMIAVVLAAINVVGGFLVTHRMLLMFQKKR
jgi:NAD(P) transhydrogenase subunit alpha